MPGLDELFHINNHCRFQSRTEAYLFSIHTLRELNRIKSNPALVDSIQYLQVLFENHEQDMSQLADVLVDVATSSNMPSIANLAKVVRFSKYAQTLKQ
jgi:hypothetical protein